MDNKIFKGSHVSGKGDSDYLRLIDESFAMLDMSPELPCLKMLYKSSTDMLSEGFIWGTGWWIQNSYGFTLGAVPLLNELWFSKLQKSYDAFWDRIGDGKRTGADSDTNTDALYRLVAPDGSLGDCVLPQGIVYKQGDGDINKYDWFYEAAAAGVNMEADILLFDRRPEQIKKYLPLMKRSLNFIERTRAENGLFLVGAASNLLAPSYGGSFDEKTNKLGKGYLTGIAVTYSAALKKVIELCRMVKDGEFEKECEKRLSENLKALPQLLTDEGYFVKSMDEDGTKHGVYGAEKYGYLEAVCNVDAVAYDIVPATVDDSIYKKIASVTGIRPTGIICNNYPHLDDTVPSYLNHNSGPHSLGFRSGDWVDGGCWCTVEGRAILAYMKLGKYDDAYRACRYYMDWSEEYRQDEPLSQWGYNTNNPWQNENEEHTKCERPVAIMIDNFAAVTCLIRGLFVYRADAEGLRLTVQVPDSISEYSQRKPVRFGGCDIYISYRKNEKLTATLDGKALSCTDKEIFIPASALVSGKTVFLSVNGAEPAEPIKEKEFSAEPPKSMPSRLSEIYGDAYRRLSENPAPMQKAMLRDILDTCVASAEREELPFDRCKLRPMIESKIEGIKEAYIKTAVELYEGYIKYMA